MNALVRKDLRLLRPVMISAALFATTSWLLLPAATVLLWWQKRGAAVPGGPLNFDRYVVRDIGRTLISGTVMVWLGFFVLLATVGATAFAMERRNRTADFTAMLPVPRWRLVTSKFVAAVAVCFVFAMANAVVTKVAIDLEYSTQPNRNTSDNPPPLISPRMTAVVYRLMNLPGPRLSVAYVAASAGISALLCWLLRRRRWWIGATAGGVVLVGLLCGPAVGLAVIRAHVENYYSRWLANEIVEAFSIFGPGLLLTFGTAWLLSSLFRGPVVAAVVAIVGTVVAYIAAERFRYMGLSIDDELSPTRMLIAILGIAAFTLGSGIQLRRQSP